MERQLRGAGRGRAHGQASRTRSSPAVGEGKVVTYGARGTLSCLDAATGKKLWRKDDFGSWPRFFTSSSPLIVDGLCIAQLGGEDKGGIVAYDLATGDQKWKWTDDGSAYSSPALLTAGGTRMITTLTAKKMVGLSVTDGKLLWEMPFVAQGRAYNAATPIVNGDTVICAGAGRGTKAVKIEKTGDGFAAKELWSNPDNAVQFNTPVLKSGQLYGISQNGDLFCLDAKEGKTLWKAPLGGGGFGSVVDTGSALLALTPQGDLVVFESQRQGIQAPGHLQGRLGYLRLPGALQPRPVRQRQRLTGPLDGELNPRGLGPARKTCCAERACSPPRVSP